MIHVEWAQQQPSVPSGLIERAAGAVLARESVKGDLAVVLTDDAQLRDLNRRYLGVDATTDVLSFSSSETDPDTGTAYLGDVLVSVPQAEVQAQAAGHPLKSEVQLLVVHGVLHLLGYDHADAAAKSRMWAAQAEVLASIGLADLTIRET